MDATDLARWTRFAAKGGIGKCTAIQDCVAERLEDLMFLKDDGIIVLLQLPEENQYLGFCEGVVGRFSGSAVQFHGKLKRPVFAKRQSGVATSTSRPASLSSRSPPSDVQSPVISVSRQVLSPSPMEPSPSTPTRTDSRNGSFASAKRSSTSPLTITSSHATNHNRVPSSSSSVSYYSNHSHNRKPSQSTTQDRVPSRTAIPPHLLHGRNVSVTSSQSAYSYPSSRTSSRAESYQGSGSEETFTHHIDAVSSSILSSLGSPPPPLSNGSSPQSSFLSSPPNNTRYSPQTTTNGNVPPLFASRSRNGSERPLPQTEPLEIRHRMATEPHAQQTSNTWDSTEFNKSKDLDRAVRDSAPIIDTFETSLASIYSQPSGEIHETEIPPSRQSQSQIGRSILIEDDSDVDFSSRKALATSPANLSYDIGMQLLQEDTDSDDQEETINTSFPSAIVEDDKNDTYQGTARQQTLIRVLNADDSSSSDEDVLEEDSNVEELTAVNSSSLAVPKSPNGSITSGMILDRSYVFPRPPTSTHDELRRSRASSVAHTDDDNWESDADIYDDYRYSRYSSYSSSPAQYNSRRASKASNKSGWSKSNDPPPMPDEDSWKKALSNAEADEESLFNKYLSDRGASTSASGSQRAASPSPLPSSKDISGSSSIPLVTTTGKEIKTRTPSPVQVISLTSSANTQSVISPLTRAFRKSMESRYSDDNDSGDERESRRDTLTRRNLPSQAESVEAGISRSKSPQFVVSSVREKIHSEGQFKNPHPENPTRVTPPTFRVDVTGHRDDMNPTSQEDGHSSGDLAQSPSPNVDSHLRVDTPISHTSSAPPSPLQPGFPPSPSAMTFGSSSPLNVSKPPSPSVIPVSLLPASNTLPSSSSSRTPPAQPAIPFVGRLPPGLPPAHMQQFQQGGQLPQQFQQPYRHEVPPPDSIPSVIRMAIQQHAPTIYGHTRIDLASSTGPVPISFILYPPPSLTSTLPRVQPAGRPGTYGHIAVQDPRSLASQNVDVPVKPSETPFSVPLPSQPSLGLGQPPNRPNIATRSNSVQVSSKPEQQQQDGSNAASQPLPRANFFPKVGQPRPRSRSFSDFSSSEITDRITRTIEKPRSQDEGSSIIGNAMDNLHRSNSPASMLGTIRGKLRPSHGPSPLSLPPTTSTVQSAPSSPIPLSPFSNQFSRINPFGAKASPSPPSDAQEPQSKRGTRRESPLATRGPQSPIALSPSSISFPIQRSDHNHQGNLGQTSEEDSSPTGPSSLRPPVLRPSNESERTGSGSDAMSPPSLTNNSPTSSLNRHTSLRPKVSIPTLRPNKSRHRDEGNGTPMTPTTGGEEDTVQIKDMEFELVKPISNFASEFHYADESASSKDALSLVTDGIRSDTNGERHPGLLTPSSDRYGGMASSLSLESSSKRNKAQDPNITVQAHRDRELKWVALISSTDAAQARKSKKIKKLLLEGVPSSVRYLVWAHIINSGSKKIANVYAQLSKRRPLVADQIVRDVQQLYPDKDRLPDMNESLVSVLFAFIAMVPDLRYHRGLTIVAGHLLMQSPEEDAFWIFLAMMDTYLRPYFMPASHQMNVDAQLFAKAVESMDNHLATRLFNELQVQPLELCGVWFSSVFAGSLPLSHLHRVWDVFFYEGIPFLFRVGLAILSLSRRHLMEAPNGNSALQYLLRPVPEDLLADPEQFIAMAFNMKLKDDDIRKSRVRMEASAKLQQRNRLPSTQTPVHPHLQGGPVKFT
ncbi:hypothetical protein Clacol_003132 [Clathrus columnatus]|uniref:Rab-GAP TBC domain-containing protein n=1 Tax=Clathrus columnatus TaxID=1419009 RepID=A0AAV5A2Q3_9AGAM|nr:hypothetical protein Clacol_003132 [Clathrus columnatus]